MLPQHLMPHYGYDGWKSFLHWQDAVKITLFFFYLIKKNSSVGRLENYQKINAMTPTATIPSSGVLLDQKAHFPSFEGAVQNTGLYMYP